MGSMKHQVHDTCPRGTPEIRGSLRAACMYVPAGEGRVRQALRVFLALRFYSSRFSPPSFLSVVHGPFSLFLMHRGAKEGRWSIAD